MSPGDGGSRAAFDGGTLLAVTHDIVITVASDGTVEYANAALERVLGYAPERAVGCSPDACVHPADRERVTAVLWDVVATGPETVETVAHRAVAADGRTVPLETRVVARPEPDVAAVLASRDVSGREHAERDRREAVARLRRVADNAGDVLLSVDPGFTELRFVNDAYEAVWDHSPADLAADPLSLVEGVHPDCRDRVRRAIERLVGGTSVDVEFRVNEEEGYGRWVRLQGTPVEEDGRLRALVLVGHDVTKRRERERQVRAMDSVLRHNLRNDMNVVVGHASQLGAATDLDRTGATHLRRIVEHSEALLETADKGRHLVELLGPDEERRPLDLAAVVRRTAAAAAEAAPRASIDVDAPEAAVADCAVKAPLAVRELVDNAIRHDPGEPTVEVTVRRANDRVEVVVADDGPPIPSAEHAAVTGERNVTQVSHGSGLGLWLVAWVARSSGGTLSFDVGASGNTVTVAFPAA